MRTTRIQRSDYSIWTIYRDDRGEWRWTRQSLNYETIGASTESYVNRADCVSNAIRNGYEGD